MTPANYDDISVIMSTEATLEVKPITDNSLDRKELEKLVDRDILNFAEFFQEQLSNSPPTDYERYFLKTYLMYKIGTKMTS